MSVGKFGVSKYHCCC